MDKVEKYLYTTRFFVVVEAENIEDTSIESDEKKAISSVNMSF